MLRRGAFAGYHRPVGTDAGQTGTSRAGRVIDGAAIAAEITAEVRTAIANMRSAGITPRLDAILSAGSESPAGLYADRQRAKCADLGIDYHLHDLPTDSSESDIKAVIDRANADPAVHGVMLHMPLPDGADEMRMKTRIAPEKDVEGVTPANIGNVIYGLSTLAPCTGLAAVELIERTGMDLRGKRVVVVGASDTVGKPIAALLMRRDATVVSCNIHTWGVEELARSADVLVAAAGKPDLITAEMVKPGAVVVDVGMNRVAGPDGRVRTVGDVSFESVRKVAGWISPVPGGVGPVTVAMLLRNVVSVAGGRGGGGAGRND